ncbi:TcpQ domain-containing protein [Photorhabdus africana]|uniref:TcpQ domain-containing protein n=1 Tax=Photorhabdus africana TaxID=3097554 RepID=UPI002B413F74|nr:TcpQ domain-containing protein [Photorhabdus sp. CRI-LC]
MQPVRGLPAIKSLGYPEPYSFVNVNAHNLRLEAMLRTIVPPGWTTVISADLKRKFTSPLSLTASDQWPYVLDQLLQKNGWVALIEWPKKTVSVAYRTPDFNTAPLTVSTPAAQPPSQQSSVKTPPTPASSSAVPRNPFSSSRGNEAKAGSAKSAPMSAAPMPAIKAAPVTKHWRAEQSSTLEDTLNLWASEEKCTGGQNGTWSVMWLTKVNYRIDAPLSFSGTWNEALNGIFRLYSTASIPLYAGISTPQCLLKVDDKEVK